MSHVSSRYKISVEEFTRINNYISKIKQDKKDISFQIEKLRKDLEKAELEEYLCNVKLRSPKILPLDNRLRSYKHITEPIHLQKIGIILYPIWLDIICYYPRWSNSLYSVKLQYLDNTVEKDKEVIINAISKTLSCKYDSAYKLFKDNKISVPKVILSDYRDTDNIILDYSVGELICNKEFKDIYFGIDDSDRMINDISIKYILVLPDDLNID